MTKSIVVLATECFLGSPRPSLASGAKRMQMFMAGYAQKESNRLDLGQRFFALVPLRIMPDTDRGKEAVAGYAAYLGVPAADFVNGMVRVQTPDDVAQAALELAASPVSHEGVIFTVSADRMELLA